MADLSLLRTAKAAWDEGLITEDDYGKVKHAFLKAQQVKAGVDAGFIGAEEFERTRDMFLRSLDFADHGNGASAPSADYATPHSPSAPKPNAVRPSSAVQRSAPAPAHQAPAYQAPAPAVNRPAPPSPAAAPARPRMDVPPAAPAAAAPRPAPAPAAAPRAAAPAPAARAAAPPPAAGTTTVEIPKQFWSNAATGKTSMAGIRVHNDCVSMFNYLRTRSPYKWITMRIDDSGKEVVLEHLGPLNAPFEHFVAQMPPSECRYAVYDFAYTSTDNRSFHKLVLVHWAPDSAATKNKMMFASTKDFLKTLMEGIGAELQATDYTELSEEEMRERVQLALTRK